jgi:parallel beta-helix repeat protein
MIMNIFIFLPLESASTDSVEVKDNAKISRVNNDALIKNAGYTMIANPIFIDDETTNNWAWAKTQPWCTGSGTALDPYLIKGVIINGGGTADCIKIWNTKFHTVKILDCYLYNGIKGINLYDCINIEISNNVIYDMSEEGIRLWDFSNIVITGNKIDNCNEGFFCEGGGYFQMSDNIIEDNAQDGLHLNVCPYSVIKNNYIRNNGDDGIYVSGTFEAEISGNVISNNGDDGLYVDNLQDFQVSGNYIYDNTNYGIDTSYNVIDNNFTDNVIRYNNRGIGIYIALAGPSTGNNMYRNFFKGNPNDNAYDNSPEGWNNEWNNTIIGNYWDDYSGSDANGDGIGDTDYNVPGVGGHEIDHLPIFDKWAPTMNIIKPTSGQVFYSEGPVYSISAIHA